MFKTAIATLITSFSMVTANQNIVVFDFGGVMTNEPNREVVINFLKDSFSLSDVEFNVVHQQKKVAVSNGMTDHEFWLSFAEEQNIVLEDNWVDEFYKVLRKGIAPNQEMYELVAELQNHGCIVGMLSNIDTRRAGIVRVLGLYDPFKPCILSCEIGIEKPDYQAYQVLVDVLDVKPERIIFVDNQRENVDAAVDLGINAIFFESVEQLREELAPIMGTCVQ